MGLGVLGSGVGVAIGLGKRVIRTEDRGETYVGTDWVGAGSGSDLAIGRANSKS